MNKFEKVSDYQGINFNLPCRKTAVSAGYDFEVVEDTIVPSYWRLMDKIRGHRAFNTPLSLEEMAALTKSSLAKPTLVPTGVKCQLDSDCYLELSVRSSTPLKYWLILANGVGIIDADYYNNPDNEGHIYFQVINLSPVDIELKRGDIIGQGIIHKYGIADGDEANGIRNGGFGSTSAAVQMAIEPQGNLLRGSREKINPIDELVDFNYSAPSFSTMSAEEFADTIQKFSKYVNSQTVGI